MFQHGRARAESAGRPRRRIGADARARDPCATIIEVGDRTTGLLTELKNDDQGYDVAGLSAYLAGQGASPTRSTTLLVEPDVSYDAVVQVMDAVRSVPTMTNGAQVAAELFPEISIGDAVADSALADAQEQ